MIALNIAIDRDDASPAVQAALANASQERVYAAIAPAAKNLVVKNYAGLPPNKMGFPSTGFWADAARSTRFEIAEDGVMVITDKIGVRQRYLGGPITAGQGTSSKTAAPTKYIIAFATSPESYGKNPSELPGLKFVRFGRGQDAPAALVRMQGEVATSVEPKKGKGKGFRATAAQLGMVVLYWLKRQVNQNANPAVLPTDEEFFTAIDKALEGLVPA